MSENISNQQIIDNVLGYIERVKEFLPNLYDHQPCDVIVIYCSVLYKKVEKDIENNFCFWYYVRVKPYGG